MDLLDSVMQTVIYLATGTAKTSNDLLNVRERVTRAESETMTVNLKRYE